MSRWSTWPRRSLSSETVAEPKGRLVISIVSYGAGNISASANMFLALWMKTEFVDRPSVVLAARKLVLPGVGSFDYGMGRLQAAGPTIAPKQYLHTPLRAKSLNFCASAAQQDRIRLQLERNIHRLLHHGQDILGTAVAELEDKRAAYTGAKYYISVPEHHRPANQRGSVAAGGHLNLKNTGPGGQCAEKKRFAPGS